MRKILIYITRQAVRLLPLAYMVFIWYLSGRPSDAVINTGLSFVKTLKEALHLIEFGILYILGVLALLSYGKLETHTIYLLAIGSALYGLSDECHQYFVPSRSANLVDLAKDTAGVLLAWYITGRAYRNPHSQTGSLLLRIGEILKPAPTPGPKKRDQNQ